jgi:hypothetical protein
VVSTGCVFKSVQGYFDMLAKRQSEADMPFGFTFDRGLLRNSYDGIKSSSI